MPLRVAAIRFLNPAPLLYDFEHEPGRSRLRERYDVHYTSPAHCAEQLQTGEADLGLIPVAALTPELGVVPGCAIASLQEVRSILLLVKNPAGLARDEALRQVRTLAADAASRSSVAYAAVLFQQLASCQPAMREQSADAPAMLAEHDAALLIGDPALLTRENRAAVETAVQVPLLWLDVAALWREVTGLPWVAAVWAVRPQALAGAGLTAAQLTSDLQRSRDAGLEHVQELVREWTPRIAVSSSVIHEYLTRNIYYRLDAPCVEAILLFRKMAAELSLLPPLPAISSV